jgi:hypothetical protein
VWDGDSNYTYPSSAGVLTVVTGAADSGAIVEFQGLALIILELTQQILQQELMVTLRLLSVLVKVKLSWQSTLFRHIAPHI